MIVRKTIRASVHYAIIKTKLHLDSRIIALRRRDDRLKAYMNFPEREASVQKMEAREL
ncbi:MAG TPA: hypothetical protein VK436_10790 [Methanocella sp.]|nr:hypothetical protein [Methanocella sp.]